MPKKKRPGSTESGGPSTRAGGGEVDALIREHDTLRELAAAVEQAMRGHDAVGAMSAMHRLLQASDLHARHEEEVLHRLAVRGARPPGERAAARGASREL